MNAMRLSGSYSSSMNPCSMNCLLNSRILTGSRISSSSIIFLHSITRLRLLLSLYFYQSSFASFWIVSFPRLKKSSTRNCLIGGLYPKSFSAFVIFSSLFLKFYLSSKQMDWCECIMCSLWIKSSNLVIISSWLRSEREDSFRLLPALSKIVISELRQIA